MAALRRNPLVFPIMLALLIGALLPSGAQRKPVRGLFWKASSSGNTIYLLGSVHLGTKEMYPLPDYIEKAFQRSSVLIVEVDLNKMSQEDQGKIGRYVAERRLDSAKR